MRLPNELCWEVIVVDNGSTDQTPDVIKSYANRLPIRQVVQPEPGLSNSRNLGIAAAVGEYIVWTDDDVLVGEGWLRGYLKAFNRWPDAAVFGGKVTPLLREPTPGWFESAKADLHFLLAARDFGDLPVPLSLSDDRLPFGANFAVRAAEQNMYLYNPALGVAPGRRRGGEETAVLHALLTDGKTGWWVPEAEVAHVIPVSRQTPEYLKHFYGGMGEASAFAYCNSKPDPLLKAPIAVWIKVALSLVRFRAAKMIGHWTWVRYLSSYSFHLGALNFYLTPRKLRR